MKVLKKILVYGGGRWAKQIIQELSIISQGSIELHIISPKNYLNMKKWIIEKGLDQFAFSYKNKSICNENYFAAIIVNSASDHFRDTKATLEKGIPTLVEKPVTLSYKNTKTLKNLSEKSQTLLCAANVFLFSKRIKIFSNYINSISNQYNIDITWTDPESELRYGELKRQDLSIPAHADYLPHILSILKLMTSNNLFHLDCCKLSKDTNMAKINLSIGDIICKIDLKRNADSRKRKIKIKMVKNYILLDFHDDDYKVFKNENLTKVLKSDENDKPLRKMLETFINCIENNIVNEYLSIDFGVNVNKLIEEVSNS